MSLFNKKKFNFRFFSLLYFFIDCGILHGGLTFLTPVTSRKLVDFEFFKFIFMSRLSVQCWIVQCNLLNFCSFFTRNFQFFFWTFELLFFTRNSYSSSAFVELLNFWIVFLRGTSNLSLNFWIFVVFYEEIFNSFFAFVEYCSYRNGNNIFRNCWAFVLTAPHRKNITSWSRRFRRWAMTFSAKPTALSDRSRWGWCFTLKIQKHDSMCQHFINRQ